MIILLGCSLGYAEDAMKKTSDGTYVINTATLCQKKGFKGLTPVEVYIKKGVVVKVVTLKNQESPGFFVKVTQNLLPLYKDVKLKNAKELSMGCLPDGCTGATYSGAAVQENIRCALEYYESHK